MKNKKNLSSPWAILPLLFCSVAVLAGEGGYDGDINGQQQGVLLLDDAQNPDTVMPPPSDASALPDTMSQAQNLGQESDGFLEDSTETSSLNTGYVGGKTRIGVSIDSDFNGKADLSHVFRSDANSATIGQAYAGVNPSAEKDKNEKTFSGAGAKINHHWVSNDANGQPTHVNKVFGAYDQNEQRDKKVTVGYGQEQQNLFWSGHVSKGLTDKRAVGTTADGSNTIFEKAYDYGVGGRVGSYIEGQQMRVQGGLDYEWGKERADGEKQAKQVTLTGNVEKFFIGTPHSVGADVEVYKKSGGYTIEDQKTDARGSINYHYAIGSDAGIWQPDQQFRRVRVEIPGEEIKQPPKMDRKLVKHTMELEADTFFELNKSKLTPQAQERMAAVAGQIRASGYEGNIRIVGNTCDLGTEKHNLDLSQRRANAVRNFLLQNGFSANELLAEGAGEANPKYPNTEAERHKNRRVDIEYVSYQNEFKDEVIEEGGTTRTDPKVVWRKELIPSPPLWVRQALYNTASHKTSVDTYQTTKGGSNLPVAIDDTQVTTSGKPVTVNVLANDSDPNGDSLALKTFDATTSNNGTIRRDGNNLIYTPAANYVGRDTFSYVVQDPAGNTATAKVTVTVSADINGNTPIAPNTQVTVLSGTTFSIDTLANATDPNGDTLTLESNTNPAHGAITRSGAILTYTPSVGYLGEDSFTYTIKDPAGNTATAKVTLLMISNPANTPVLANDTATTASNKPVTIDVLANDKDPNNDTLTIKTLTAPEHGSVSISGDKLVYTPATESYTGTDSFNYTVSDPAGNTASASVLVTLTPAGMPAIKDDAANTPEGRSKTISVLDNDSDPDGDALTVASFTQPAHGTVTQEGSTLIYTPTAGYTGEDTFTYTATDGKNQGTGKVQMLVTPLSGSVIANGDAYPIPSNSSATPLGILANDTVPAGATTTVTISKTPTHGTVKVVNNFVEYTPETDYKGGDSFTYKVTTNSGLDSSAEVVLNVGNAPKVWNDTVLIDLNDTDTRTLDVLANDTGDELQIVSVSKPAYGTAVISKDGKSIQFTLRSGYCTDHTFTYQVKDKYGLTAYATVTVDVSPPNTANENPNP